MVQSRRTRWLPRGWGVRLYPAACEWRDDHRRPSQLQSGQTLVVVIAWGLQIYIYIILYNILYNIYIYVYTYSIYIYIHTCMYSTDTLHSRYHSHLRKELSLRDMPWVIRIRWPPKTAKKKPFFRSQLWHLVHSIPFQAAKNVAPAGFFKMRGTAEAHIRKIYDHAAGWILKMIGFRLWEMALVARKGSFVLFFFSCC